MPEFVSAEPTIAYRVGRTGRRFFTETAAYRAAAKAKIKERCECEDGSTDNGFVGHTCEIHRDMDRYQKLVRRLAFKYRRFDQREIGNEQAKH